MKPLFLGVEIGATKQQLALGDADGNLLYVLSERISIPNGAQDILDWLKIKVPEIIVKEKELEGKTHALAVGFGGIIESETGKVMTSVQVKGWKDFELKEWFETKFKLPAKIINDTVAGGYGELITGSGRTANRFFYTNIGSGIGGAIFIDGKYYDGQGYGAGYFGHTYIPDCLSSVSGEKRKVEDMCSGFAIERRLRGPDYVKNDSELLKLCKGDVSKIACRDLACAAKAKDEFALSEIDLVARSFSVGLSNLITLFAPDIVSIGGGVSNLGDVLLDPIRKYTDELVFASSKGRYSIVQCSHMDNAVLVGSILFAKEIINK